MALKLYAKATEPTSGSPFTDSDKLPSPIKCKPSFEPIWSENTGRAQSGTNKAKMIGDVIAEKRTYQVEWDMLTPAEFNIIKTKLKLGFFYFGIGTTASAATSAVGSYYRSEISSDFEQITASDYRYRNVAVSIIEQ